MKCSPETERKKFIKKLFANLQDKDYALLKSLGSSPYEIGEFSDLDILCKNKDKNFLIEFITGNSSVGKYKVHSKSFMDMIYIFFKDGSFLQIDIIYNFVRKGIIYLNADDVLKSASINNQGIKLPALKYEFAYVYLFYTLNKVSVEKRYKIFFSDRTKQEKQQILEFFSDEFLLNLKDFSAFFKFDPISYFTLQKSIERKNSSLTKYRNYIFYIMDVLSESKKSKTITFSGVDGAGKTTIINEITSLLKLKYRQKVVVLRHRPSLLPIISSIKYGKAAAEKKTLEVLPRSGKNSSLLSSFLRFLYYLTDYVVGQWFIFFKYQLKGYIVIYDRYYFDFINDSKRTNIQLNEKFVLYFYRFIFKPEINNFLYASPEVILERKQELDKDSIINLTTKYKNLFSSLRNKNIGFYSVIENLEKSKTVSKIENYYINSI